MKLIFFGGGMEEKIERWAKVVGERTLVVFSEISKKAEFVLDNGEFIPLHERQNLVSASEREFVRSRLDELSKEQGNPLKEVIVVGAFGVSAEGIDSFNVKIGVEFENPIVEELCKNMKNHGIPVVQIAWGDYGLVKDDEDGQKQE